MATCECLKPELDLFSNPPTQTSVKEGQDIEYHPFTALEKSGPIKFVIDGTGDEYLDLYHTNLYVEAKVVCADGSALPEDTDVAPVNLTLHSLFSQVDVSLNDRLVTSSKATYPYRAYLETLLSYGQEAKATQLSCEQWYKDSSGHMDATQGTDNKGFVKRKLKAGGSSIIDMSGKLHIDMMFGERYVLNGVNTVIQLVRSSDAFVLMADGPNPNYKMIVTEAILTVRKVTLSDTMKEVHIRGLNLHNAKYPIRRLDTFVYSVPQGNLTANQDNLFLSQLPKRLVIGCVDNDAYNGNYHKNPYNFKHYDINFVALNVHGRQIPGKPLQPNFEKGVYVKSYQSLYTALNKFGQDEGNQISRNDYAQGYTLFAFNLTPDLDSDDHFTPVRSGPLRLEIHFAKPLPNTINVIILAEFENTIEVNKSRNILFDYTP